MSENIETRTEKKTPKEKNSTPSITAIIVAFAAIFLILGFLILTKDFRNDGMDKAEESELENKIDVVDTTKDDKMEDEDAAMEEEEDVLGTDTEEDSTKPEEEYLADLYIHEYTLSKEDPMQNEEITVHIEIVNDGDFDTEEFHWEWWADTNELGCDGDVDWLDVGEKETVECEYTYDDYGDYETRVVIDSEGEVDESDEYNNVEERDIEVAEEEYVDLRVTEYSFDPIPEKAVPFTVRIGITNDGNIAAEDFYWEWWGTYANYACREQVASVAPGSTKVVTCDYTYGGWSTYDTKAVVDADNDIEESNEDNNEYQEDVVPIH